MADCNTTCSLVNNDLALEEPISNDIDDDIDDAIEEGYMGMECTLERGFSLNESEIQKDLRLDRYEELSVAYERKKFPRKYSSAIKHFVTIRKTSKCENEMTIDDAGFFSYMTFSWVSKFMWKANKTGLTLDDLPLCSKFDMCNPNFQRLEYYWDTEVKSKGIQKASLHRPVWIFIRTRIILALMIFISTIILGFMGPTIFMRGLINWMSTENPLSEGAFYAVGLIISELLRILLFGLFMAISHRTATRLRSACLGLVYNKLMKISHLGSKNVGQFINLYANDSPRIYDFVVFGPMIVGGPLVAVGAVFYILYILGPWSLLGMTTFLIFYPLQYLTSRLTGYFRRKTVTFTDNRVCLMNEILLCIKLIKMCVWEEIFTKSVLNIRDKERRYLEKSAYVYSVSVAMAPTVPVLTAIVTFLIHIGSGNNLTAAQAFSIYALMLREVRRSFTWVSLATRGIMEFLVSIGRLKSILSMEDMESYVEEADGKFALQLQNASFGYCIVNSSASSNTNKKTNSSDESNKKPLLDNDDSVIVLQDLNFSVLKGEIIGVCGGIGAGKSSLLLAVMGQMRLMKGKVMASGSFAYVGQQPWILNATLKENIIFGEPFNAKRYYKVMYACGLTEDISRLPAADNTEIGERGINISGGQKQRLSLARALYSNKDIYLLDDCLSAVDANVGQHIFRWVIQTALKRKTVVFVSHQMQYMTNCDKTFFMQDGKIAEIGAHSQLISLKQDYFTAYQSHMEGLNTQKPQYVKNDLESDMTFGGSSTSLSSRKSFESQTMIEDNSKFNGHLTTFERIEKGDVPASVYKKYINYSGGPIVAGIVVFTFALNISSTAFSSWWLSYWLNAGNGNSFDGNNTYKMERVNNISANPDREFYQIIYGISIVFIFSTSMVRGFAFMKTTIHASSQMHRDIFCKIFRSPMSFFDTTPSGRILNIFSQDFDEVDTRIPITMEPLLQNLLQIGVSFFFVCFVFPYFLFFLLLFAMVFLYIRHVFSNGIRDFKRLENVLRSPLYSHITTTINGLNSIQAYQKQEMFTRKFMMLLDDGSSSFFLFNNAVRWLAIRLDLLAMCCTAATAFLSLLLRDSVGAAFAGLALAYSFQLSGLFQYTVRLSSEMEARFTSVHRILTYIKTLGSEGTLIDPLKRPNPHWPKFGKISFKKVCMSYREDTPVILKSITFDVNGKEKIGVVGRTGSGKSSLGVALFRLAELNSGSILIDGLDISSIGLKDLRSHLSIIPQDPVLFIGTIRYNLDPLNCCSDEEIWSALQKTQLRAVISKLDNKLESAVIENGENFSIGEKQLLCMARALLRKSTIIFLDEATAGIDSETDSKIQKTLQNAFENCTVITVAHRLNTIMSCSRILVMNNGKIAEYDSPQILLARPTSQLSKLVESVQKGAEIF